MLMRARSNEHAASSAFWSLLLGDFGSSDSREMNFVSLTVTLDRARESLIARLNVSARFWGEEHDRRVSLLVVLGEFGG